MTLSIPWTRREEEHNDGRHAFERKPGYPVAKHGIPP
jgi:hypothetical protein